MLLIIYPHVFSCGSTQWYAIEEHPAEKVAYVSGGVYVNSGYIRSAYVAEIDGNKVKDSNSHRHAINAGVHVLKIYCDEAKGSFNSDNLLGNAKTLKFNAEIQREYKANCQPYTHWWIEDVENGEVVAGSMPEKNN